MGALDDVRRGPDVVFALAPSCAQSLRRGGCSKYEHDVLGVVGEVQLFVIRLRLRCYSQCIWCADDVLQPRLDRIPVLVVKQVQHVLLVRVFVLAGMLRLLSSVLPSAPITA